MVKPVDPASATILFGAGVTRAAGGPTAYELVEAIADDLITDAHARRWVLATIQPRGELRFETAVDELAGVADPDLEVLDLFEQLRPGHLHGALATAAGHGARLVTVNFDDLAEQAISSGAWTVDLQERLNIGALKRPGAVVKLHGTQRLHRGGAAVEERGSERLQATIASIVAAGGGAGLRPDVEERLRELVDRRVLVVIGYSGSDDLDVVPSLQQCVPARVVWVQHADGEPRPARREALTPGSVGVLEVWRRVGAVSVDALAGATEQVLELIGWPVPPPLDREVLDAARRAWVKHVHGWAARAAGHDSTGLAWTAEMQGSVGRFDLAAASLEGSRPSTRRDGLWPPSRRAFALAENAYLRDLPPADVRRLAEAAVGLADRDGEPTQAARSLHVLARTYRTDEPRDLVAARAALDAAVERLRGQDAPGMRADIELERARVALAEGDDAAAAELAARAADGYRAAGHLAQLSESLQARAHALTLDDKHDEARETLAEAARIARIGPYPEREIAAAATGAMLADDLGRIEDVVEHAEAAIDISERIGHTAEVAQMYAFLGLSRIEQGRFADAARAFRSGIGAVGPSTRGFLGLLVCGLATSLLAAGDDQGAQRVLVDHRAELHADRGRHSYLRLLEWALERRRGEPVEWDDAVMDDAPFDGEMAFAFAALGPSSPGVSAYLDDVRAHLQRVGQHDRLRRLDALRASSFAERSP